MLRLLKLGAIGQAISKLEPHLEVREKLWDRMTSTMQLRMQDKQTSVRVFAASALSRLVIADDIQNDVTVQAYRKALASDPSTVSYPLKILFLVLKPIMFKESTTQLSFLY
jgi:hypothetical protein